jgi:hypothetical protein
MLFSGQLDERTSVQRRHSLERLTWHGMSRLLPRRLEGERIRQVESGYVFILEHYSAANTGC